MSKSALKISSGQSGRLDLANWIASKDNPLTARVMANRVWLHLFGRGLVPTADNFGSAGQPRAIRNCSITSLSTSPTTAGA